MMDYRNGGEIYAKGTPLRKDTEQMMRRAMAILTPSPVLQHTTTTPHSSFVVAYPETPGTPPLHDRIHNSFTPIEKNLAREHASDVYRYRNMGTPQTVTSRTMQSVSTPLDKNLVGKNAADLLKNPETVQTSNVVTSERLQSNFTPLGKNMTRKDTTGSRIDAGNPQTPSVVSSQKLHSMSTPIDSNLETEGLDAVAMNSRAYQTSNFVTSQKSRCTFTSVEIISHQILTTTGQSSVEITADNHIKEHHWGKLSNDDSIALPVNRDENESLDEKPDVSENIKQAMNVEDLYEGKSGTSISNFPQEKPRNKKIFSNGNTLKKRLEKITLRNSDCSESPNKPKRKKKKITTGCWRKENVNGVIKSVYVSLSGQKFEGAAAYEQFKMDQNAKQKRIDFIPENGSIEEKSGDPHKLSFWGIPIEIERMYFNLGISQLYDWQVECLLQTGVLNGKNLVYLAPTNGGKTLVSEIVLIRNVILKRKKAIFVLPYVSLVLEKTRDLQEKLRSFGLFVKAFHSHVKPELEDVVDVAISTPEKANAIIVKLIEEENIDCISTVIVDEVHLLGDSQRGATLEMMLSKLLYLEKGIQLIAMSATFSNVSQLGHWFQGNTYTCTFRPIPLKQYVCIEGEIFDVDSRQLSRSVLSSNKEKDEILVLVELSKESLDQQRSVLVFTPTREWCSNCSLTLSTRLRNQIPKNMTEKRANVLDELKRLPNGICSTLEQTIPNGIAYHHAGLSSEERTIIENAFRNGSISLLVATSTLAAGVNLPAHRVIIRSPHVGLDFMDPARYHQMIGRAGRSGQIISGSHADSILMTTKRHQKEVWELVSSGQFRLSSRLEGPELARVILEALTLGICHSRDEVICYLKHTLFWEQSSDGNHLNRCFESSLKYLIENGLVQSDIHQLTSTRLGFAVGFGGLPLTTSLILYKELEDAMRGLLLRTNVHLIYLCCFAPFATQISEIRLPFEIYQKIMQDSSLTNVSLRIGVSEPKMEGYLNRTLSVKDHQYLKCSRFVVSLLLKQVAEERQIAHVARTFNISRGTIQSLQSSSSSAARMISVFCEKIGWRPMALLLAHLAERLSFGVQPDLMNLMQIPAMTSVYARALYVSGIKSVELLAKSSIESVISALQKGTEFTGKPTSTSDEKRNVQGIIRKEAIKLLKDAELTMRQNQEDAKLS